VKEKAIDLIADTVVIEAKCPNCYKKLNKVWERPIKNYTWSCDCCRDSHPTRPGFEFYSCKKCRMDWCNKPACFESVEIKTIVKSKPLIEFSDKTSKKSK
jgi:hypothetical protein